MSCTVSIATHCIECDLESVLKWRSGGQLTTKERSVKLSNPGVLSWIVQAMKHELKIRAGDMPPQDIYQLSPSDVKQLLLDVLQPQHTSRYTAHDINPRRAP